MTKLTGGQALARQLVNEGVEVIFGLPGDQTMHAIDGLYETRDQMRFITTRHEQGTTYMADGYARATGRVGVSFVVPGIGVYNAAGGLATAYATSSPVVMLAGQVPRAAIGKDMGALHDVHDQLEIVRPITKWATRVLYPTEIPAAVNEAFARALSGRPRPTHVEAPPEAFAESGDIEILAPRVVEKCAADPTRIAEAARMLLAAERPMVVVGGGVIAADATAELRQVVEQLQAAVVATREGKGAFDDRLPLSLGVMWTNPRIAPHIHDADIILAVGTRFGGIGAKAPTKVVQLDADATELGKQYADTYGVAGDAKLALAQLRDELDGLLAGSTRASRGAEVAAARAAIIEKLRAVGPQTKIVEDLRAAIPEDGLVVTGTTTVGYMSHMRFDVYEPRTYFGSSYMGTLGFAFPTSLGVKVGRPDRKVVSINGDGGFLFCASELATAVQYDIPVVALVFNDGAYGNSNRDQRERFGGREFATELRNPDFAKLAEAYGADGIKLTHSDQVGGALREALDNNRPTVIEVPIPRLPSPFV
jgi:acetolactate synthase I/II/III large subunit